MMFRFALGCFLLTVFLPPLGAYYEWWEFSPTEGTLVLSIASYFSGLFAGLWASRP